MTITELRKYATKDLMMADIDVKQFILLSQDKYENSRKQFYRVPVQNFIKIANTLKSMNQHLYEILPQNRYVKPYFDLEMEMLEPGYSYNIGISIYDPGVGTYVEQPNSFKFKVNKYDY